MRRLLLLLAAGLLVLAACSSSDDSADDSSTTTTGDTTETTVGDTATTSDTGDLPSFETVTEIGDALGCDLDYDGVEDEQSTFSTCVFEDEQAYIYVYKDPTTVEDVVALGAPGVVFGANWTIQTETDAAAQTAATATGGQVAPTS